MVLKMLTTVSNKTSYFISLLFPVSHHINLLFVLLPPVTAFIGSSPVGESHWQWSNSGSEATGRSQYLFLSGARRETDSQQVHTLTKCFLVCVVSCFIMINVILIVLLYYFFYRTTFSKPARRPTTALLHALERGLWPKDILT